MDTNPQDSQHSPRESRRDIAALRGRLARVESQIQTANTKIQHLSESSEMLHETLAPILKDLSQLVEMMNAAAGAFKVLEFLGRIAKPLLAILSLVAAGYAAFKQWKS